ncbi:uncharacterized protein isoform X2 [Macaca fascicularis]|uniref:uncharacterized protein isoform X2 n=1 Tax=Macaca fascicularis TaxID=9541 RepID=UPI0032B0328E
MRRVALGALQGLSSRRRLRRCIGRLEVLGVLAPGRGRSRAGRRHAHHRAWRWNSNRACERALRYQLGDKIHGFTVNQDLQNVLSVYLDATFFPCLRELDFWQEGWWLEHENPSDPQTPLVFKGVIFSEMKGGFTDNERIFPQHLQNRLLPDHTYSVVSGGDPLCIPELTWEQLKQFHATHYHPSNARTRMKTCTPAVRAFSLTGAPRAISTGHYVDASVTKWKASGPGGACSDQERPESKKHETGSRHADQAGLKLLGSSDPPTLGSRSAGITGATHASLNPGRCSRWRNLQEADLLGFANGPSGPRGICCAELLWIRLFNTRSLKTPRPYLSTGDSRARVGFIENKSLPLSALVCHVSGCLFHPDKHDDRNSKQRNSKKIHTSP